MPQNTNLNRSPYFADFDPQDNYYRVLFKPGVTVQTRELTNLQSTLQNQVEQFGKTVYSNTIAVNGGGYKYNSNFECVQLESTYNGVDVEDYYTNLIGVELKGKTSGVTAEVVKVLSRKDSTKNTTTLYINYKSSSDNGDLPEGEKNVSSRFRNSEDLLVTRVLTIGETVLPADTPVAKVYTPVSGNATYTASSAKLLDGIFFIRGFFIEYESELIILDQYSNSPSYRVGLQVTESLVDSNEDNSLNDNAQGFSNFAAPGADRLKITINLIKKSLSDLNDDNFIEIFRVQDGVVTEILKTDPFSSLSDILARRTFDESGNYYVDEFKVSAKESLNDYLGNGGIYYPGQKTVQGETPSDDLAIIKVNPGKAYVKGYEISTGTNLLEYEKPRTTRTTSFSSSAFYGGTAIRVNNVVGAPKLGLTTTYTVSLFDQRLSSGVGAGDTIGVARIYDFEAHNNSYEDASSEFNAYLFDIQTYTKLTLQSGIGTMSVGSHVRGVNSGATGFVRVKNGANVTLYQVAGQFKVGERLLVDGIQANPLTLAVSDYSVNDIKSIYSSSVGFGCDTVLNRKKRLSGPFTVDVDGSSVGTITSDDGSAFAEGMVINDIVQLSRSGVGTPVYSRVTAINNLKNSITVVGVQTVTNVCQGDIGTSVQYSVQNLRLNRPNVLTNPDKSSSLYSELKDRDIADVDTVNSNLYVKRQYTINRSGTSVVLPNLSADYAYVPFDEEDYLVSNADGTYESLSASQFNFSTGFKSLTITGLSNQATATTIFTTQIKGNITSKSKKLNRCSSGIVSFTKYSTPKNASVSYQKTYGTRIEDPEISLNVPDAVQLHGVFESSTNSDPQLPYLEITGLNSTNSNTSDLIIGELVVGRDSKAVAMVAEEKTSSQIYIIYKSKETFIEGEVVKFQETGYTAEVTFSKSGDKNIVNSFRLDNGQKRGYYDISRIVRTDTREPSRRLKFVFDYFSFEPTDGGDVITATSYNGAIDRKLVPVFNGIRNTDIVDVRPRVSNYTSSSLSPFEFDARNFSTSGANAAQIMAPYKNTLLKYDFYLGRVDKLRLRKSGKMSIKKGTPAVNPAAPSLSPEVLDIATIYAKPYVYDIDQDIEIVLTDGKRYTMKDLRDLESRIDTLEYLTSLNLLELETKNLTIEDADGLNRFKSGFFADNFSTDILSDVRSSSYRARRKNNTLTAERVSDRVPMTFSSSDQILSMDEIELSDLDSTNLKLTGKTLTLDYTPKSYIQQPFASRTINVNPFNTVTWSGLLKLNPEKDTWAVKIKKGSITVPINLEGQDSDGKDATYMRSRNIEFKAFRLKPNTRFKVLIDGNEISSNEESPSYCFPKLLEIDPPTKKFEIGETVLVFDPDNNSQEIASFRLCAPNHKSGKHDDPTEVYDENPYDTSVSLPETYNKESTVLNVDIDSLKIPGLSDFYGNIKRGSKLVGKNSKATTRVNSLKLISDSNGTLFGSIFIPDPRISTFKINSGTVEVEVTEFTEDIDAVSKASANYTSTGTIFGKIPNNYYDPIAQTFFIKEESGVFLSSIDVYFSSKPGSGKKIPVTLQIREVVNGYPGGPDKIVNGMEVVKKLDDINISEDASVPTKFEFENLRKLDGNKEYAMVLLSDSSEYNVWISRTGEVDISTVNNPNVSQIVISKQPSLGSMFRSQNNTTWTAAQSDDLKFDINCCEFSLDGGSIKLYNSRDYALSDDNLLPENPISITTGGSAPDDGTYMKIFHPNHGFYSPNCRVKLNNVESDVLPAKLGVSYDVDSIDSISLDDATSFGTFEGITVSPSDPGYALIDNEIIEYTGVSGNQLTGITREIDGTSAVDHLENALVYKYEFNGVSLRKININHIISSSYPITIDSYYIGLSTTFSSTVAAGGGTNVHAPRNRVFDTLELVGDSIDIPDGTNLDVSVRTVTGTSASGTETAFEDTGYTALDIRNGRKFDNLRMIPSNRNERDFLNATQFKGRKSLTADIVFSTENQNVSPVLILDDVAFKASAFRIDQPISLNSYADSATVSSNTDDPHTFIHLTERVDLVQSANSLKVIFDAYKPKDTDIRVLYKIYRNDVPSRDQVWQLFPGYKNLDINGNIIDSDDNDGRPDQDVRFSNKNEFIEHQFTIDNLPDFTGFAIKIVASSTNQTESPIIKNLRGIALV